MTCLDISFLLDLLPSWLKHFIAIPSHSDRSYTSSANNSLLEERSSSLASHKCPVNSLTGYVPGITVLPSPPPTYLSTTPKSTMHGYQAHESSSFHRTPPLGPPIIFPKHAADRPMNGPSRCPIGLWSSILIKSFKVFVIFMVKSNSLKNTMVSHMDRLMPCNTCGSLFSTTIHQKDMWGFLFISSIPMCDCRSVWSLLYLMMNVNGLNRSMA